MIDIWEQWWDEDWHGKTKTPEQECIPATYNINSTIISNIKIIFWTPGSISVSIDDPACLACTPSFPVHLKCILLCSLLCSCVHSFQLESGGAGLLYCQSLILDVPVPDGFFFTCLQ